MRRLIQQVFGLLACSVALIACEKSACAVIRFDSDAARRQFEAYVAFIEHDPARYSSERATVRQLEQSGIEYRIRVGGDFRPDVDGTLSTDGSCVVVAVSDGTGSNGKGAAPCSRFSERACLAHELEHARQFDSRELSFTRDVRSGRWVPDPSSYDIGDEVNAWRAQLHVATGQDFWRRTEGSPAIGPSLLAIFAAQQSDAARASLLQRSGYGHLAPTR